MSSGFPVSFALRAVRAIDRPVDVARLILGYGTSLKKAHAMLDRITAGERVCLELRVDDSLEAQRSFHDLGIAATPLRRPAVSVTAIRRELDLTQAEFALRFGFETETVRNWEQGRNSPDPATQVLLAVIREAPDVVDRVMSAEAAIDDRGSSAALRTISGISG